MRQELRRFSRDEAGDVPVQIVFMLALLGFTVGTILLIGPELKQMLEDILAWLQHVLGVVPSPPT
jgi:hypothetical protein